jgi:hypothetical protein
MTERGIEPETRIEDPTDAFLPITETSGAVTISAGDYLADLDVREFVKYLRGLLGDGTPFRHCYRHAKEGYDWQCDHLLDALRRYRYKVVADFRHLTGPVDYESIAANAIVLAHLKTRLRKAIAAGPHGENAAVQAAKEIQTWGGTNRTDANSRSIDQLHSLPSGFLGYLAVCRKSFGSTKTFSLKPFISSGYGLRSNAGFTKIYSLAFDNFIIYDSRVAAAIGLFIVRYWAQRSAAAGVIKPIPPFLALLCMPIHGDPNRNPNLNAFNIGVFPQGSGRPFYIQHLKSNIFANWILNEATSSSTFAAEITNRPHPYPIDSLRGLEAALFMIGYDLSGNWPHTG